MLSPGPADATTEASTASRSPELGAFAFWLAAAGGLEAEGPPFSLAAIESAIRAHLTSLHQPDAEPLRWAITAVDPDRGLLLEGVAVREPRGQRGAG